MDSQRLRAGETAASIDAAQQEAMDALAGEVLDECRKTLMLRFRFLNAALWHMPHEPEAGFPALASDGVRLCFEPYQTVEGYRISPDHMARCYLHSILHCVFRHPFERGRWQPETWSLACDIFVESIALEMCGERFPSPRDDERRAAIAGLRERLGALTPKILCRSIERTPDAASLSPEQPGAKQPPSLTREELQTYQVLFAFDSHRKWAYAADETKRGNRESEGEAEENSPQNQQASQAKAGQDPQPKPKDEEEGGSSSLDDAQDPERSDADGGTGNEDSSAQDDADAGGAEGDPSAETTDAGQSAGSDDDAQGGGEEQGAPAEPSTEQPGDENAEEQWEDIAKQVEMDLAAHAGQWAAEADTLCASLQVANRKKYDYADFLRRFCVLDEDMRVNDDEFDYVYYTYGLDRYGNIPLVEPLEYMETKRIREFAIVIDTSGSCSGELVTKFIERTFSILKESESFSSRINVHIIQADARVQDDVKVTSVAELDRYLDDFRIHGFGGTDFRPAFAYVDELLEEGDFENLQGLIYFTDGEGIYPKKMPQYETAFVFLNDHIARAVVPPWAMKVVMDEEDVREL